MSTPPPDYDVLDPVVCVRSDGWLRVGERGTCKGLGTRDGAAWTATVETPRGTFESPAPCWALDDAAGGSALGRDVGEALDGIGELLSGPEGGGPRDLRKVGRGLAAAARATGLDALARRKLAELFGRRA